MIEVRQRKRTSIFQKVESYHARNIGERSVAIVRVENISLVTAPRAIGADQFVNRAPSLLVILRRLRFVRRIGNYLPPEKTVEVFVRGAGDHAIDDVEIGKTIMIKIPGVARPRPAPDSNAGSAGCILESTAAISRHISK